MENNIDRRQRLFLIIIAVLTLFFAVVGATFAYFTIIVQGNEEASSIYIKSVKLGQVIFEDGQVLLGQRELILMLRLDTVFI